MRAHTTILTITLAIAALAAPTAFAQQGPRGGGQRAGSCGQLVADYFDQLEVVPLSAAETAAVRDLREEEKLARDVYLTLAERWQLPVFGNIARAEQAHMNHVADLLAVYGVADPVVDDTVGAFTSAEYAGLYQELVARGEASLVAGLEVGATIEDLDLADLANLLAMTDNAHVGFVGENLAKGSRNHLRAFSGALEAQSATYTAQYLDQDVVDAILAAPFERGVVYDATGEVLAACGGGRGGRGWRGGWGGGGRGGSSGGQGSGNCDGTGPHGRGGGQGSGNCDGTGPHGPGNGVCDGTGPGGN